MGGGRLRNLLVLKSRKDVCVCKLFSSSLSHSDPKGSFLNDNGRGRRRGRGGSREGELPILPSPWWVLGLIASRSEQPRPPSPPKMSWISPSLNWSWLEDAPRQKKML